MNTVSIVVCTHNRARSLENTLRSINRTECPTGWSREILVIDNGSTDGTRASVASIAVLDPTVRYVFEPQIGKAHAYNRALQTVAGSVVLFTDDDVLVPRNWVTGMADPIIKNEADAVAGGVRVPPYLAYRLTKRPLYSRRQWFAISDYLDPAEPGAMIGANMAVHTRVFSKVAEFDAELGPGALGFQEESLFSLQMLASGFRLRAALDVAVEHHFDPRRLEARSLREIATKIGRSTGYIHYHWNHRRVPLLRLRFATAFLLSHIVRRVQLKNEDSNVARSLLGVDLRCRERVGYLREMLRQQRSPMKYPRPV